jgi:hypothetical protein
MAATDGQKLAKFQQMSAVQAAEFAKTISAAELHPEAACAGWLLKQSDHVKKFNKRWFVLWPRNLQSGGSGRYLVYYAKPTDLSARGVYKLVPGEYSCVVESNKKYAVALVLTTNVRNKWDQILERVALTSTDTGLATDWALAINSLAHAGSSETKKAAKVPAQLGGALAHIGEEDEEDEEEEETDEEDYSEDKEPRHEYPVQQPSLPQQEQLPQHERQEYAGGTIVSATTPPRVPKLPEPEPEPEPEFDQESYPGAETDQTLLAMGQGSWSPAPGQSRGPWEPSAPPVRHVVWGVQAVYRSYRAWQARNIWRKAKGVNAQIAVVAEMHPSRSLCQDR